MGREGPPQASSHKAPPAPPPVTMASFWRGAPEGVLHAYLQGCLALVHQALDQVILGLRQQLLNLPPALRERDGPIAQVVQDRPEMLAAAVDQNPAWEGGEPRWKSRKGVGGGREAAPPCAWRSQGGPGLRLGFSASANGLGPLGTAFPERSQGEKPVTELPKRPARSVTGLDTALPPESRLPDRAALSGSAPCAREQGSSFAEAKRGLGSRNVLAGGGEGGRLRLTNKGKAGRGMRSTSGIEGLTAESQTHCTFPPKGAEEPVGPSPASAQDSSWNPLTSPLPVANGGRGAGPDSTLGRAGQRLFPPPSFPRTRSWEPNPPRDGCVSLARPGGRGKPPGRGVGSAGQVSPREKSPSSEPRLEVGQPLHLRCR